MNHFKLLSMLLLSFLTGMAHAELIPGSYNYLTARVVERTAVEMADTYTYFNDCNRYIGSDQDTIQYYGQDFNEFAQEEKEGIYNVLKKTSCYVTYGYLFRHVINSVNWLIDEGKFKPASESELVNKMVSVSKWTIDKSDYLEKYNPESFECHGHTPRVQITRPHHGPSIKFPVKVTCKNTPYGEVKIFNVDDKLITVDGLDVFDVHSGRVLGKKLRASFE